MHTANKYLISLLLLLVLSGVGNVSSQEKQVFTLAVVPQLPAQMIREDWYPLLEKLSEISGKQFRLVTYSSISQFESSLIEGEMDLAYMNPYHLLMTHKHNPYTPLVRDKSSELVGILVVKKNSKVKTIKDLQGTTIAFPSPNAFGASLYMRALLSEKEHIRFSTIYSNTHSNVYRNVIFSRATAGGGVIRTLKSEPELVKNQLRILYKTPGVAPHPLSAHPKLSDEDKSLITESFLKLLETKTGKKLLRGIQMENPIRADFQRDYQPLSKLKLDNYFSPDKR